VEARVRLEREPDRLLDPERLPDDLPREEEVLRALEDERLRALVEERLRPRPDRLEREDRLRDEEPVRCVCRAFFVTTSPSLITPRQAPVSSSRISMNALKRAMSARTARFTCRMPRAAFSSSDPGSRSNVTWTRVSRSSSS
jgi:hypothetical protein